MTPETGLDDDDDAMEEVEVNPVESNPLSFSAVGGDGREVAVSSRRSMGVAVRVPSTVSKTPRRGMRSSFGIPSSFDALMAEEVEDEDVYDTKPAEDSVKQGAVRVPVQTHPSDSALASRTAVRPATASATGDILRKH